MSTTNLFGMNSTNNQYTFGINFSNVCFWLNKPVNNPNFGQHYMCNSKITSKNNTTETKTSCHYYGRNMFGSSSNVSRAMEKTLPGL